MDILVSRSSDDGATWTAPAWLFSSGAWADPGDDFEPQLTTDGAGHWVAVWWSTNSPDFASVGDLDILVSRSNDNGATWSFPRVLNSNAAIASVDDLRPQIATGRGEWLAVWTSNNPLAYKSNVLVSRSSDNGATWSAAAHLNVAAPFNSNLESAPQVTTDGAGNWVAVWESYFYSSGRYSTFIMRARSSDGGVTWTGPTVLSINGSAGVANSDPHLATDRRGSWIAVWRSSFLSGAGLGAGEGDLLVARSSNNGASWTAPALLNSDAAADGDRVDHDPQLTTDAAGNWVVVWWSGRSADGSTGTGRAVWLARSYDHGVSWRPPVAIFRNPQLDYALNPRLTTDRAGHWVAAWQSVDSLKGTIGGDGDILVTRAIPERDQLVADLGPSYGAWIRRSDVCWEPLHAVSPAAMASGDVDGNGVNEVVLDFGPTNGTWLRRNDSTWEKVTALSSEAIAVADLDGGGKKELVFDFGPGNGIWVRRNDASLKQLHPLSPRLIAAGDLDGNGKDELISDFGPAYGIWIWRNDASWEQLHGLSPKSITSGDLDGSGRDELVIDFSSPNGIWLRRNDALWEKTHGLSAKLITTGDIDGNGRDDVLIDFGASVGIWLWRNAAVWEKVYSGTAKSITTCDVDTDGTAEIVADFGAPYGSWLRRSDGAWDPVNGVSSDQMLCARLGR